MYWKKSLGGMWVFVVLALTGCGAGVLSTSSLLSSSGSGASGTTATPSSPTSTGTSSTGSTPPSSGSNGTTTPPPSSGSSGTTPPPSSGGSGATTTSPVTVPRTVSGHIYSGPGSDHPISGATISLYAVGTSGYGTGSTALLQGTSILTASDGSFSLDGAYTCPSATTQVYLVASGGNAGAGENSSITLLSALGGCSIIGSSTIVVNEITTAVSVFALSPFLSPGGTSIGTSSSNSNGLLNAFRTANNLYDGTTGQIRAKTLAGNGTIPANKINLLANLLANCVQSLNGAASCPNLFQATSFGGSTPGNTFAAVLNLALHPGLNLGTLALNGPYQNPVAGAPSDWTLSIEYTGGGLNYGQLIAADGSGNIWVPNSSDPGTLSKFGPAGEPLSGNTGFRGGGLSYPLAVAIDQDGNVWAANEGNSSVSKHSASGAPLSGSGFATSGLKLPYALALDSDGNVFTANGDNTVTKLNSSGNSAGQFQQGGLDFPYAIAVDTSKNLWIANYGYSNSVSKFANDGTVIAPNGYTGGINGAAGAAIDGDGSVWVASFDSPIVSKFSSNGTLLSGSGYTIPAGAASIAVDGSNTVWTANSDGSISHFGSSGALLSPSTGFIADRATAGVGIAIDASGNVWTSDNSVNSLFEYIGVATPAVTPLQVAVKNTQMGKRP